MDVEAGRNDVASLAHSSNVRAEESMKWGTVFEVTMAFCSRPAYVLVIEEKKGNIRDVFHRSKKKHSAF